jgi:site-specific recombinase XerC
MISAFKLFFDWLESNHSAIADQNPTTSIELSNLLVLNSALRPREVSQLWDAILAQDANELVIARDVALLTCIGRGLTAQEIQNANVQDLNNEDNRRSSLRVRNSEDWFSREVLLSRSNQEAFEFYIQLRSQNKRRLNLTSQSPLLVSYNERTYGYRLNYVEIVGTIKHWKELSNISNLNLQRLRNTFSTQLVFSFLGQECQGRDLSVILAPDHEAYFKAIGEEPPGVGIEEFLRSVYR